MKVFLPFPIEYDGREYAAGVHEITVGEATGFYMRGGRPATAAESVAHDAGHSGEAETEQALAAGTEKAALPRNRQQKARA